MMGEHTIVVPFENGVEAADQTAAIVGREHIFGGFCKIMSYVAGAGHIRHAGVEPQVAFGELDNRKSERATRLLEIFQRAGISTQIPPDIHTAIWEKFLF